MNERIKAYLRRIGITEEEYAQRCDFWQKEYDRLTDLAAGERFCIREYGAAFKATAVRHEASSGGEHLHRGYYCPSLIQDIAIDNAHRGKLCEFSAANASCKYSFDAQNRLIATRQNDTMEYIRWE